MEAQHTVVDAARLARGYVPFLVDGHETGELSEVRGREDVRTGVFRVSEGVYPDRTAVPYLFEADEYIWIVEGEVHIKSSEEEEELVLRAGDSAFFRRGSESTWTFHAPFRKFSVEIGVVR
ncbi:cupin domain-containing protein [Streptomyces sp. NPDC088350]|uniref:cupin domain-containing protein n=1 Tax=Streptomyces sp. NPDC088350 TaxID=3365854 RepID=UPI0037F58E4C